MKKLIVVALCIFATGCGGITYKYRNPLAKPLFEEAESPLMLDWNRSRGQKSGFKRGDELWKQHREEITHPNA